MGTSVDFQVWAGRLCLALVGLMGVMGLHFGNIRFAPVAAGFAILAGVFYSRRLLSAAPARSLADSGRHRAL